MATLCFSSSSTTLLHNSIDFYSATIFSPKRLLPFSFNENSCEVSLHLPNNSINQSPELKFRKWRTGVSFFSSFLDKNNEIESLKQELLEAIAPLDRGAAATPEDQRRVDQVGRFLPWWALSIYLFDCILMVSLTLECMDMNLDFSYTL